MRTLSIDLENPENDVPISVPSTQFSSNGIPSSLEDVSQKYCLICWDSCSVEKFKTLECQHSFCEQCLQEYLKSQLTLQNVLHIRCPYSGCPQIISKKFIQQSVSQETFTFYESLILKKVQSAQSQTTICPKPGCSLHIKPSLKRPYTQCSCGTKICNICHATWHEGKTCLEAIDQDFEKYTKQEGVKFCIICKTQVLRVEGCKHMTCPICDFEWCWDCGRQFHPQHELICPKEWSPIPPTRSPIAKWLHCWRSGTLGKKIVLILFTILLSPLLFIGYILLWPLWDYYPGAQLSWKKPLYSMKVIGKSIGIGLASMIIFAPIVLMTIFFFVLFLPMIIILSIFSKFELNSIVDKPISRWALGNSNEFNYTSKGRPDPEGMVDQPAPENLQRQNPDHLSINIQQRENLGADRQI